MFFSNKDHRHRKLNAISIHFLFQSVRAIKGTIWKKKKNVALPVLRSSVSVSDVGSVVERSSSVEEEAFVVLPVTSVATVVDTAYNNNNKITIIKLEFVSGNQIIAVSP